jgi:hypothetical protein
MDIHNVRDNEGNFSITVGRGYDEKLPWITACAGMTFCF